MAVKGVFASDSGIQGDRVGDFASALLTEMPTGSASILALSSGMESRDAQDTVTTWFEENHISGRVHVTNNAGTGTTIEVNDASTFTVGGIFLVESSGEYLFVTGVNGLSITVQRGFAGTTASAIDGSGTNVPIQKIGTAFEEGSNRPVGIANLGYPRFNYQQIFRNSWDITGTARRVKYHTGNMVSKNRRDAAMLHAEDIERSLLWGRRSLGVKGQKPFRTMDGIMTQITTNTKTQATNVGYTDIRDFLQAIFERNVKGKPNERIAFCGNTVLGVLDTIAASTGRIQLFPGQTDFGMEITKWRTPFGNISLMTHPLMNESPLWTKDLYVLHPGAIRTRYLRRTREDSYDQDGERAGVDADYGVFTSELNVEYFVERTGGKYTGIDTPNTSLT